MWEEGAGHHLVVVVERAKNFHVFRGRYRMPTHNVEVTRPDYFIRTGWVGIIGHVHFIDLSEGNFFSDWKCEIFFNKTVQNLRTFPVLPHGFLIHASMALWWQLGWSRLPRNTENRTHHSEGWGIDLHASSHSWVQPVGPAGTGPRVGVPKLFAIGNLCAEYVISSQPAIVTSSSSCAYSGTWSNKHTHTHENDNFVHRERFQEEERGEELA